MPPRTFRGGTSAIAKSFFFNVQPSEYLFVAVVRKRLLESPTFNLESFCRRATNCMRLNTAVNVPSNPTPEERVQIASNRNRGTAYFSFARCRGSRRWQGLYTAAFNQMCFSARVLGSTSGNFLPDMQSVFYAWTMQQMPRISDGSVLVAFESSRPDAVGLSMFGNALMKGNRWRQNYADRAVLMSNNEDGTSYNVIDWSRGTKRERTRSWDDSSETSVIDVIDNQLNGKLSHPSSRAKKFLLPGHLSFIRRLSLYAVCKSACNDTFANSSTS